MAIKAKVLIVDSKRDAHDFKCFAVQRKYDADIVAFAVGSKRDAHELKVLLVDRKYDADKTIFFVKSKYEL